jgi:hypothetical protein
MKTYLFRSFVGVIVLALATVTAFADKVKKVKLTFADDVMVSGTLVKAGTYDFRFNHDTGELSILKEGQVKVKTAARLEPRSDKAKYTAIRTRQAGNVVEFTGLVLDGQMQEVVVTSAATIR